MRPVKPMKWMNVRLAKRKIIPGVVLGAFCYTSYKYLVVTKSDPGILACNSVAGTSVFVSKCSPIDNVM